MSLGPRGVRKHCHACDGRWLCVIVCIRNEKRSLQVHLAQLLCSSDAHSSSRRREQHFSFFFFFLLFRLAWLCRSTARSFRARLCFLLAVTPSPGWPAHGGLRLTRFPGGSGELSSLQPGRPSSPARVNVAAKKSASECSCTASFFCCPLSFFCRRRGSRSGLRRCQLWTPTPRCSHAVEGGPAQLHDIDHLSCAPPTVAGSRLWRSSSLLCSHMLGSSGGCGSSFGTCRPSLLHRPPANTSVLFCTSVQPPISCVSIQPRAGGL